MQTESAQFGAVSESLSAFYDTPVSYFPGSFDMAFKVTVQMVISSKFIQRLQDITRPAQRAVIRIPIHGFAESTVRLLPVWP